jgi:hypothetical protein
LSIHQDIFSSNIEGGKAKGNCTIHEEAKEAAGDMSASNSGMIAWQLKNRE